MRAIQAVEFGDPTVLELVELPDPEPGAGEIAIDVTHSAVGLVDLFIRRGAFKNAVGMPRPPFIPGLEVAGTVRSIGSGMAGFAPGESVVAMSSTGTGGYASVYIAPAGSVVSTEGHGIDPALAVAMIPNAAMAYVALAHVAHLRPGESVLVHGALGGFPSAFPGIARQLGASRVVGTVRAGRMDAAAGTQLPYDRVVDSASIGDSPAGSLAAERFDVIIDVVGGDLRSRSLALLKPGGRLVVAGNASGDDDHVVASNALWLASATIAGFNAGAYLPLHPEVVRPALEAALQSVVAGRGDINLDVLPLADAALAHERLESRALEGRIVLVNR